MLDSSLLQEIIETIKEDEYLCSNWSRIDRKRKILIDVDATILFDPSVPML